MGFTAILLARFYDKWEFYWRIRSNGVKTDQESKRVLFAELLPKEEADRAMHKTVTDGVSFNDLIGHYQSNCTSMLPSFVLEL